MGGWGSGVANKESVPTLAPVQRARASECDVMNRSLLKGKGPWSGPSPAVAQPFQWREAAASARLEAASLALTSCVTACGTRVHGYDWTKPQPLIGPRVRKLCRTCLVYREDKAPDCGSLRVSPLPPLPSTSPNISVCCKPCSRPRPSESLHPHPCYCHI